MHEKNKNLGFRPSLTQTGLYSHRSRLETLNFGFKKEEVYYSENKGADQLRGYREADLRLCFRIAKIRFSCGAAAVLYFIDDFTVCTPLFNFHFTWYYTSCT